MRALDLNKLVLTGPILGRRPRRHTPELRAPSSRRDRRRPLAGPRGGTARGPQPHHHRERAQQRRNARNIDISAGMGAVFEPQEPYTFTSDSGAIVFIVESDAPTAHERKGVAMAPCFGANLIAGA